MKKFLLYVVLSFLTLSEIYAGGCLSRGSSGYVKLDCKIKNYLLTTEVVKKNRNLYDRNIDGLKSPQECLNFIRGRQFASEAKLICTLYAFYGKGKLPRDVYILYCFLSILACVIERKLAPEISECLVSEYEKVEPIYDQIYRDSIISFIE